MLSDPRELIRRPRYSSRAFPAYRFTPGRDPHPIANPLGHSYQPPGSERPHHEPVTPEAWRECEPYLYACDLYNHAYWWEAHEEWEGIWKGFLKGSAPRRFLQGLIQVSACHLKLYLGHLDGVERLRRTSAGHLRAARSLLDAPILMGVDIDEMLRRVDAYYSRAILAASVERAAHDPKSYPYLQLQGCP